MNIVIFVRFLYFIGNFLLNRYLKHANFESWKWNWHIKYKYPTRITTFRHFYHMFYLDNDMGKLIKGNIWYVNSCLYICLRKRSVQFWPARIIICQNELSRIIIIIFLNYHLSKRGLNDQKILNDSIWIYQFGYR